MKRLTHCGVCGIPKPGDMCRPCSNRRNRVYKLRNATRVKAGRAVYRKAQHAAKAGERAAKKAARIATKRTRRQAARSAWKIRNKGKVNASTAQRFAAKLHATPQWANKFFIGEAYELAALRSATLGAPWHVDHQVPLRSPFVCGLHTEQNLCVVSGAFNEQKGNRYWPDMPGSRNG